MNLFLKNSGKADTGETALDKFLDPDLRRDLESMREILDLLLKLQPYAAAAATLNFFPSSTARHEDMEEHFTRLGAVRPHSSDMDTLDERLEIAPLLKAVSPNTLTRVMCDLYSYIPKNTKHMVTCQEEKIPAQDKAAKFNILLESLIDAAKKELNEFAEERARELANKHLLSIRLPEGIFLKRDKEEAMKTVSGIVEACLVREFNAAADRTLAHEAQALAGDATYVPPSRGSQPDLIDRLCDKVGGAIGRFIPRRPEPQGVPSLTLNFLLTVGHERNRAFDDRNQIIEGLAKKLSDTALTVEICRGLEETAAPQTEVKKYPWLVISLDN